MPSGFKMRRTSAPTALIGAQATERDAPLRAVVHAGAMAVIAAQPCRYRPHAACGRNGHSAEARRSNNSPRRTAPLTAALPLPVALLAITRWFLSNSLPGDVALVLILEQNVPFGHRATHAAPDALATLLDAHLARRAPEGIGAGIDRVGQNVVHGVVGRQSPDDAAPLAVARLALATRCLRHATRYAPDGRFGTRQIWRRRAAVPPEPAGPDPSRSGRARPSHSRQQRRGSARRGAPSASVPRASAGETATAQVRSSSLSCQATVDHWDGEDHRFRPRRR